MPASYFSELLVGPLPASLWLPLGALAAVLLDRLLGEPRRFHPLVGFGTLVGWVEKKMNRGGAPWPSRFAGITAWSLVVLPFVLLAWLLRDDCLAGWLLDVALLCFALGGRSLAEHAQRVGSDLSRGDLAAAREHVGWMVSRDTAGLDEAGVAKACIESTLENGNDAIFGALFWFALLGGQIGRASCRERV